MRVSPFLLSTALIAGVIGVCASSNVQAQSVTFLQPQTAWTLAQFDGEHKRDAGYCAIARRYEQNMILTLAQNGQYETSLAVDFQVARLNPDNALHVKLNAGREEQRAFQVDPVSNQAFVVRLGRDDDFLKAMGRNKILETVIGNRVFSFNVGDAALGLEQLGGCVSTLVNGAGAAIAASQPEQDVEDITDYVSPGDRDYEARLAALRQKAQALPAEDEIYTTLLPVSDYVSAQEVVHEMPVLSSAEEGFLGSAEVSGLVARVSVLEQENDRLREALIEKSAGVVDHSKLQADLESLRDDNRFLMGELADAQAKLNGAETSLEEKGALGARVQELTARVETLRLARDQALATVQTLEKDNAALKESLAGVAGIEAEVESAHAEMEKLAAELRAKDQKILDMGKAIVELDVVRAENKKLRQDVLDADYKNAELVSKLKGQIAHLEQENKDMQVSLAKMAAESEEGLAALGKIRSLEAQIAKLQDDKISGRNLVAAASDSLVKADARSGSKEISVPAFTSYGDSGRQMADISYVEAPTDQDVISMSLSADPYEDITVEDRFTGYALGDDGRTHEVAMDLPEASVELVDHKSQKVAETSVVEVAPLVEEIITFNQDESQRVLPLMQGAKPLIEVEPLAESDLVLADVPAAGAPMGVLEKPAQADVDAGLLFVSDLLKSAALDVTEEISTRTYDGQREYQWGMGNISGLAAQMPLRVFEEQVKAYLEQEEKSCDGDFAIIPDVTTQEGGMRIDTYEAACVEAGQGMSTSFLFFNQGGEFAALSQRASTDDMDAAMDARDRLLKAVQASSKI